MGVRYSMGIAVTAAMAVKSPFGAVASGHGHRGARRWRWSGWVDDGLELRRRGVEVTLPQYETERVLAESLGEHGTRVRRGVELVSFTQDDDGVTATVRDEAGQRTVTARYLIGCDGAHSAVRKGLG